MSERRPIVEPSDLAWHVFRSEFKDGEHVVLEDYDGNFQYGKLAHATDDGILLVRPNGRSLFVHWEDIVFMAHDGFPVAEIMGMSYHEAVERAGQTPTKVIREKLKSLVSPRKPPPPKEPRHPYPLSFGGGCPFVFGPCYVEDLLHPGNNGPRFWGEDTEETLVLRAVDGAVCHSYDMSHLFLFDGLRL